MRAVGVNVSPAQNPKARNDLKVPTLVSMNIIPCGICARNVTQSQTCIRRNKKKPRLEREWPGAEGKRPYSPTSGSDVGGGGVEDG